MKVSGRIPVPPLVRSYALLDRHGPHSVVDIEEVYSRPEPAMPHSSELTVNTASPVANIRRRPRMAILRETR